MGLYADAGRSTWVINVEAVDPVESCTLLALITFFRGFVFTEVFCTVAVTPVLLLVPTLTLVVALVLVAAAAAAVAATATVAAAVVVV